MRKRDRESRLDKEEEFGFCVSAFLSAASSVQDLLKNQQAFTPEREAWLDSLDQDVRAIVDFMFQKRRRAVHYGDDAAKQVVEPVPIRKAAANEPGTRFSTGFLPWAFGTEATIGVATYTIEAAGRRLPATDVCAKYLTALEDLINRFEPEHRSA